MARPLRIQFPGAFYHVTARGNERKAVFKSKRKGVKSAFDSIFSMDGPRQRIQIKWNRSKKEGNVKPVNGVHWYGCLNTNGKEMRVIPPAPLALEHASEIKTSLE